MYQNRLPQRCSSTSQDVPAVLPRYPGWRWRSVVLAGALGCGMSLAAAQTVLLDGATGPATVPAGVYWLDVTVTSASGGGGGYDEGAKAGDGGAGVTVTARVAVVPGQTVSAVIGQAGAGGLPKQIGTGGGAGGAGAGAGGNGGNANLNPNSGGGGGGGGASVVTIGSSVVRAGGGGGGGGGSWQIIGHPGASAATSVANAADCATPAPGEPGLGALPGDGAGGGGGGGGYLGAAGTGGKTAIEDGPAIGAPAQGGGAGGSCVFMTGPNVLQAPPTAVAGPAGGVGASTNAAGGPGNRGTVRVVTNASARLEAAMAAAFSNVPPTLMPGQTSNVTLTCTNNGPGAAIDAACVPTVASGGATVSNVMCTPPSPAAVLDPGAAMVCTFDLTATSSAGPVELAGTASGGTGPAAVATAETAVQAAGMSVAIGLPANVIAGATAPGTLVCTNSGPAAAPVATCALDALPAGSGEVRNLVCTPTPPTPLAAGEAINCTFDYVAPAALPAGPVTLQASTTSGLTGAPVVTATASLTVTQAGATGVQAVPTLQFWGLLLMSGLLAGLGLRAQRGRSGRR